MKSEEHKTTDIYNDYLNKAFEDMSIGHSMNTNLYKDSFKEIVRQKSVDKNVDPNSINYIFQTYALDISYTPPDCLDNLYGKFYPHIEKCMGNQGNIHQLRIGIINRANDGVTDIQRFKDALNKCNTVEIERLKMERNQLITLYVNKCVMHQAYQDFVKLCEQSGESFEGNEVLLEIKDLQEKLKEKIDQKLDNHNFDEQTKSYALQLFNSQQHLKKLQYIEQSIKPINDDLLTCGISSNIFFDLTNFQKFESLVNSLNQKKQEITNWKNRSDSLTEEIINTVIEFAQEKTSTTLEIKSIGENLEETINKGLADKNIDEEVKNQVWQMPFYSSKYKEVLDKLETHKQLVKTCENKILNCDTFVSANSLNMELKKIHKDRIEELNFYTNQVVKHFVTKALQISGKPLEETSMMSDIKNLPNEFNEKINKNFEDNLIINEKVKSAVDKLFHSKCVEHLKNLELIEKSVKKYEHELLMCNDFKESKKIVASLNQKQKEIDNWKLKSDNLTKEIINQAVDFSCKESEMDSVIGAIENNQHINHLIPEENPTTLKIKGIIGKFKEKLNRSLNDNNITEKVKSEVFKIAQSKIEQHLEKLKKIEKSFLDENINLRVTKSSIKHWENESINFIREITNMAIKLSYNFLYEISKEEGPMILEIKSLLDKFKEKLNDNLTDSNIKEKIKFDVCKMYRSKCDKHLEKLKIVKDLVKKYEDELQQCNGNYKKYNSVQSSVTSIRKKIDDCKLESDNLIEEIVNKAIEFSYQTGQVQPVVNTIPNQQNNLTIKESEMDSVIEDSLSIITTHSMILNQSSHIINPIGIDQSINSFILGGASRLLEIKNLLSNFKEKLNASLDENSNINQKIKFDVCKIYKSRCEQHLENLKVIEKSVAKYEDLPNSQKTEKINNHLAQRYKQIDKWKIDSDNLIEKITVQALELSYKIQPNLNEQNNLQVQKLMDEMVELKNMVKMNQNLMEIPPIENLTHSIIESLDDSKFEKSISSSWLQIDKFSENNAKKELEAFSENNAKKEAVKTEKKRGEIKGDIRMIKMGVKENWPDEKIKPFIKKIIKEEIFQEIKDAILSKPINLDDSGYESGVINESDLMGQID